MRKFFRFTGICALLLGLVTGCTQPPEPEPVVGDPSNHKVGTVTATTAPLSWTAAENAEKYFVQVGDSEPVVVTSTSYTATRLDPETEYTWNVQAINGDQSSEKIAGPKFTTEAIPVDLRVDPPTGHAYADLTHNSVTLTWEHSDAETHEVVLNDGAAIPVDELTHIAEELTPNTEYTWKVRSGKEGVWSEWANGEKFATYPTPTGSPVNLRSTNITEDGATLSWYHMSELHEVSVNDGDPILVTEATYTVTGLAAMTEHTWKVRSAAVIVEENNIRKEVWSDWSESATFTTIPAAPTGLAYSDVTAYGATLTWEHPAAESYEVIVDSNAAATVTDPTYTATKLFASTKHTWRVRALQDGIWSAWAEGEAFTTANLTFPEGRSTGWLGERNTGTNSFQLIFSDIVDGNGTEVYLEFVTGSVDMDPANETIDLPLGEYVADQSGDASTISVMKAPINSYIRPYVDGTAGSQVLITGGMVTISGDPTNYVINFDLIHQKGNLIAEYEGPITINNPRFGEAMQFTSGYCVTYGSPIMGVIPYTIAFSNVENGNGMVLSLMMYLSPAEVDLSGDIFYLPEKTYRTASPPPNSSMIMAAMSSVTIHENGVGTKNALSNCEMIIAKEGEDYHIEFNFGYGSTSVKAEFNGPLPLENKQ